MKPDNDQKITNTAKEIFEQYLLKNKLRRTPERFAILEEIYRRNDHFDADQLYDFMKQNNYHISRATVYNTLELLYKCKLVQRHQFGQNSAIFEKAYGSRQHDHLICLDCGKIFEFCDPRLHKTEESMGQMLKFKVESHSLTLYGHCQGACDNPPSSKKTQ